MAGYKLNIDDFVGENTQEKQAKLDAAQKAYDTAWDKVNPTGTAYQNLQKPTVQRSDFGSMTDWAEAARAAERAYDNGVKANAGLGENQQIANALASGQIDNAGAQSSYGIMAGQLMDKAASMAPFQYDFNNDTVFKSLQNSYMREAKRAAAEAQAQAAARTGGYGNSYGAVAASQQYNNALQNLYDQIPELEQAAYNRYLNDKQDLYNQRDWYAGQGDKYYDRGYQEGRDAIEDQWRQKEWDYGVGRDTIEDLWRQKEWDYGVAQDQKGWDWKEREANREQGNIDWEHGMTEKQYEDSRGDVTWDHNMELYKQQLNTAMQAASLGNYSMIADMLGIDMSRADSADNLNMAIQLINAMGGIEYAAPYIQKLLGTDLTTLVSNYASSGGSSGGSKGSNKGGTKTTYQTTTQDTKNTGEPKIDYSVQASLPNVYNVDTSLWDRITGKKK